MPAKDESSNPRLMYRVANRAFLTDKFGNTYTGEQLMLALLLHSSGKDRSKQNEMEVGRLLDDPNQSKD